MNSQNRMNAGAEYVLYRIWATIQDREGIHAPSLLTCLGALAGYACQSHVRQAGARAGVDATRFALTSVTADDGSTYLDGEALNLPLAASPLSVWSLVRRAVQKIGGPVPDIEGICAHVTRTLGTSEFGVPRAPDEHRPRLLPIVYLTQLWPQVLPIAQRFCRRPAQLPVLFGIALQRAIEHTAERLSPTLGASIAMECAVAMSKVALPTALSDLFQAPPAAPDITVTSKPTPPPPPLPETRRARRKRVPVADPGAFGAGSFTARVRSAKGIATIMSLAIIAIAGFTLKAERREPAPITARVERGLKAPVFQARTNADEQPFEEPPSAARALPVQEALPMPMRDSPPSSEELALPAPTPDRAEGIIAEDGQSA